VLSPLGKPWHHFRPPPTSRTRQSVSLSNFIVHIGAYSDALAYASAASPSEIYTGPQPSTTRGAGIHIGKHPKLPKIIYPSGKYIVVRDLTVRQLLPYPRCSLIGYSPLAATLMMLSCRTQTISSFIEDTTPTRLLRSSPRMASGSPLEVSAEYVCPPAERDFSLRAGTAF
jgi:hypothetical protein